MTLQDKVEQFISSGEIAMFEKESDTETVMCIYYRGKGYEEFKNNDNYDDLYDYFNGREVTLSITAYSDKIVTAIVDKATGDSLNIKKVNFVTGNFSQFLNTTPKTNKIKLIITGMAPDGKTKVIPQKMRDNGPIEIQGYSYINRQ